MPFKSLRRRCTALDRSVRSFTEPLEPRTLFSVPPITPAPQAQVAVSGVRALLVDPTRDNVVYMVADRRVIEIDTGLARTVAWGNIQANGQYAAVSPAGDRLYVAEPSAFAIEVLSLPDLAHVDTLHLSVAPGSIAAGVNDQIYVATYGGQNQQLVQVDAITGASATRMPLWGSNQLRATPDGTRVFYTLIDGGSGGGMNVDELDVTGPTPQHTHSYPVYYSNSKDFEIDTVHRRVFTANGGVYGVGVTLMDSGFQTVWSFDGSPYGTAVALSPDSNTVYGSSGSPYDGVIQSFDVATGNRTANYSAAPYAVQDGLLAPTANGRILYVGDSSFGGESQHLVLIGSSTLTVDDLPIARATASTTPTGDGTATVSFDATASTSTFGVTPPDSAFAWDFGDGQTDSGPTPHHAYATPGTYTVKLTVTGSTGLTDDLTLPVTLSVTANPGGPYALLADTSLPLSSAGSHSDFGGIVSYEWDIDYDGSTFTPDLTGAAPTFDAAGLPGGVTHALALRITDSAGNTSIRTTTLRVDSISVVARPDVPNSVISGKPLSLNGATSASNFGPIVSYEWDTDFDGVTFTPDLTGAAQSLDTTGIPVNTTRVVALRVTDAGGHVNVAIASFLAAPATVVATPGGPYTVLAGRPVTLDGGSSSSNFGPIVTYEWDTNYDGSHFTPDLTGPSVTLDTASVPVNTTRTLALRVTDAGGNTAVTTTTLTLYRVSIAAIPSGPVFVIPGQPVTFSGQYSSSNFGPIVSYEWDTDYDGASFVTRALGPNPTIPTDDWTGGDRTIALRVTDSGGNTAVATLPFVVIGVPVSGLPVDPPPVGAPPVQGPLPAAAITVKPVPALGAATTRFTVTYVGYAGIDAATLDGLDIRVVGPHGYDRAASFVSAAATDSTSRTISATYEIPAPVDVWDGSANGAYSIRLNAIQVSDQAGQAVPPVTLGGFVVNLARPDAPDLRVRFATKTPVKLTAGDAFSIPLRLSNAGTLDLVHSRKISVRVFASTDPILDDGDLPVGSMTQRVAALKKHASEVWTLAGTAPKVPANGKYYLLAEADSSSAIKERNEDNNVARAAAKTRLLARTPDLSAEFAIKSTSFAPDQYVDAYFRLTNNGTRAATGLLPVRVYAMRGTHPQADRDLLVLDTAFKIKLRPGASQVLPAFFPAPEILAGHSGFFYVVINGSAVGDHHASNDVAIARSRIAIH